MSQDQPTDKGGGSRPHFFTAGGGRSLFLIHHDYRNLECRYHDEAFNLKQPQRIKMSFVCNKNVLHFPFPDAIHASSPVLAREFVQITSSNVNTQLHDLADTESSAGGRTDHILTWAVEGSALDFLSTYK